MGTRWYATRIAAALIDEVRAAATDPDRDGDRLEGYIEGEPVDIDKAWHGIHRLLTGTAWDVTPGAGSAILGGEPLVEEDVTVTLLPPEAVRVVADGLAALDPAVVAERYDPEAFIAEDIYPNIWEAGDRSALDDYLLPHLASVAGLYREAAAAGDGLLLYLG